MQYMYLVSQIDFFTLSKKYLYMYTTITEGNRVQELFF